MEVIVAPGGAVCNLDSLSGVAHKQQCRSKACCVGVDIVTPGPDLSAGGTEARGHSLCKVMYAFQNVKDFTRFHGFHVTRFHGFHWITQDFKN